MFRLLAPLWAAAVWLAPLPVLACYNTTELSRSEVVRIVRAAHQLELGHPLRALSMAHAIAYDLRHPEEDSVRVVRRKHLFQRARLVMAIAVVRLRGRVDLEHGRAFEHASPEQRNSNLAWALRILEDELAQNPTPFIEARVAEALALDEARWQEGLKRLHALQQADLMPDAFAWSTLARLELRTGATTEMLRAHEQCKKLSGDKVRRICGVLRTVPS